MTIHIFNGDKGGVGKSMAAVACIERLQALGREVMVIETDVRNGDVGRIFPGSMAVSLHDQEGWAALANALVAVPATTEVVINLPAQAGAGWESNFEFFVEVFAEEGLTPEIHVYWPINAEFDSINLLVRAMESPGVSKWIVIKNLLFTREGKDSADQFGIWKNSKVRDAFLAAGGQEICLPRMAKWVATRLRDSDCTVSPSKMAADRSLVPDASDRVLIKQWLRNSAAEFGKVQ